ncbi:UNVERIFIED_CONTAM: hypothetical protein Slati_3962800 [Sesamum latifolium]|uniref:Nucleotide-diphospho-sugar transferase domain-containing protein n=1 Tax=Sesamum latifolium TaxID=2727402 RepID=A0AAW2TPV4_9LAMI
MSADYLKMMWRRIDFLRSVLEMGYNFIFSDTDIMWLRDPFRRFYPDGDFQIACDTYKYESADLRNMPNGGFTYVKSNNRTIQFYKFGSGSWTLPILVGSVNPARILIWWSQCTQIALKLENKIHDIKMVIVDWKRYMGLIAVTNQKNLSNGSWTAPWRCGMKNSKNRRIAPFRSFSVN